MNIYIDESGNLGTGGEYFVLAFVCTGDSKKIKNIFKKACIYCNEGRSLPLGEIKTSALSFPHKQAILNKIVNLNDFNCGYIVARKDCIYPGILGDKNLCYNYLCKILLKKLFDGHIPKNKNVNIILDNRTQKVLSKNTLPDYIKTEAIYEWSHSGNIGISYKESHNAYGLQCADFVSNLVYGRYTYGKKNGLYGVLSSKIIVSERFPWSSFK